MKVTIKGNPNPSLLPVLKKSKHARRTSFAVELQTELTPILAVEYS